MSCKQSLPEPWCDTLLTASSGHTIKRCKQPIADDNGGGFGGGGYSVGGDFDAGGGDNSAAGGGDDFSSAAAPAGDWAPAATAGGW